MIIRSIGHASFRIDLANKTSIVTDPFDPSVGYELPHTPADLVTMSHQHHDHNYIGALAPAHVADAPGRYEFDGVTVEGLPSFHDDAGGAKRGPNTVFIFEAEGLRIAHLGDLGHMPDETLLGHLRGVDVMMIPVGGVFTIDAQQAAELTRLVGARITVPMHYAQPQLSFRLGTLQAYLDAAGLECARLTELDPSGALPPIVALESGHGL